MDTLAQLDLLIANQKRSVRWYVGFALVLFVFGLTLVAIILSVPGVPEQLKSTISLTGLFAASVCALPFKEVNACWDRLSTLSDLKAGISSGDPASRLKIEALVWEVLKKTAGG